MFSGEKIFPGHKLGGYRRHRRRGFGKSGGRRLYPVSGKVAGTSGTAENTAAVSEGSVPVRAGKAAVQSDFVNFFTETVLQIMVQGVIGFPVPKLQRFCIIRWHISG